MKLKWQQAPVKTQWGDDMVVASVAIDKDHTVCLYCEREQIAKVEVMFTSPPTLSLAQRTWQGLTDEDIDALREANSEGRGAGWRFNFKGFARAIEAKLRSKNEDRN